MTDTILNLDDLSIPFANRVNATVIDGDIALPTDFATAYSAMMGAASLVGQKLTISGLESTDTIGVTGAFSMSYGTITRGQMTMGTIETTATSFTLTIRTTMSTAELDQLIQSLTFQTTDTRSYATRDLTFSVNTPNYPQSGTVKITIGELPHEIGDLDAVTIPFENRFQHNVIDSDLTLPEDFLTEYNGATASLNGRTLTITGLQFQDAIRASAGSGFVIGFPKTTLDGVTIATTTGTTNSFTMTFTTDFTAAQLENLLRSLTFQAGAWNTAEASRTLSFSLNTPTPLQGTVGVTLSAPEAQNQIQDLDNQNVVANGGYVTLDSAITLSEEFTAAYSATGSLNNVTMAVTGWTGQSIPLTTVSGSEVAIQSDIGLLSNVYVGKTQIGMLNTASGTFTFNSHATAALVEQVIEALMINPQVDSQTSRTITVTIMTPTLPQFGTVTFTQVPFTMTGLRDSVDVSYNTVLNYGLILDSDVAVTGNGPWGNGKIEVTGLGEGDKIMLVPEFSTGIFVMDDGSIEVTRSPSVRVEIGQVTPVIGSGFVVTLTDAATTADIEKLIECLMLSQGASGTRDLTVSLSNASGHVVSSVITVNVGYTPTLTDMAERLDLTFAEAAAGQLLDADVSFRVDSDLEYGSLVVTGVGQGEDVSLRTDGASPVTIENGTILIEGREVGTLTTSENGPTIAFTAETTAADVEAMIENLVFRTTAPDPAASRDITITISDTDGETDVQVVTVNTGASAALKLSYQLFGVVDGVRVPVQSGTTGDFDPADLFGTGRAPDSFIMRHEGLLDTGGDLGPGEQGVISFRNVAPGTVLVVDGVSYPLEGPEGRLTLDLAPGLHRITLELPYEAVDGKVVTASPVIVFGTAVPPETPDGIWPDVKQTDLFLHVSSLPPTLYRLEVTTTVQQPVEHEETRVVYVTSIEDRAAQIDALRQFVVDTLGLGDDAIISQSFRMVTETSGGIDADTLTGTDQLDLLDGGAGDDLILGSLGADTIDGGTGVNTLSYERSDRAVTVDLTKGTGIGGHADGDVITNIHAVIGSRFADLLIGSAGVDSLFGGAGDDTVQGRAGADILVGGNGNDSLSGEAGNDVMRGGAGRDFLSGGADNDVLWGGIGLDTLSGGAGNDMLRGGAGADSLDGGEGVNRTSYADSDAAVSVNLQTGTGAGGHAAGDILVNIREVGGSIFDDVLTGSTRIDVLIGGDGDDTISGARGFDRLFGGAGDDSISGGDGDDLLVGGLGADTFDGGRGIDTLSYAASKAGVTVDLTGLPASGGDAAGDVITNVERIIGSAHADLLTGGAGAETLEGAAGDDRLSGGAGSDVLTGGTGSDTFVFGPGSGSDVVTDFGKGDSIALDVALWGEVKFGDVGRLLEVYGYEGDGYVELRFDATNVLRIEDVTLLYLRDPGNFLLTA